MNNRNRRTYEQEYSKMYVTHILQKPVEKEAILILSNLRFKNDGTTPHVKQEHVALADLRGVHKQLMIQQMVSNLWINLIVHINIHIIVLLGSFNK